MTETIEVTRTRADHQLHVDDMMRYHGPHSPAGVAMAFKVMQRAFGELRPAVRHRGGRSPYAPRSAGRGPATGSRPSPAASLTAATRSIGRWFGPTAVGCSRISYSRVTVGDRAATLLLRGGFRDRGVHRHGPHRAPHRRAGNTASTHSKPNSHNG